MKELGVFPSMLKNVISIFTKNSCYGTDVTSLYTLCVHGCSIKWYLHLQQHTEEALEPSYTGN